MSNAEVAPRATVPLTTDDLERIFHEALRRGDARGVETALTLMAPQDPDRAQALYDALKAAIRFRRTTEQRETR